MIELLEAAKHTERLGYDGFFRSDDYLVMPDNTRAERSAGLPGSSDAWITLAGLASETARLRLGTLMTSATFRHPGFLAVQIAVVEIDVPSRHRRQFSALGVPHPKALVVRSGLPPEGLLCAHVIPQLVAR
jgi:hypothetical protein